MDGSIFSFFLLATFLGGLVSGLAGFAMGIVVSSMCLHILTPVQTATLIVGYGLLTQGFSIWKSRHALSWRKGTAFIIGGALGVPVGTKLLTGYVDPAYLRLGFGLLLVVYSIYIALCCDTCSPAQPAFKPIRLGVSADTGIGIANGIIGGLTGLTGFFVAISCQIRGWTRREQRSVFQPVNFAIVVMSAAALCIAGVVTTEMAKLYLLGLPSMLTGCWIGFKLYGKLDEAACRRVVPLLLLASGLALIVRHIDLTPIERLFGD